jgi:hypothetical protein
MSVSTPIKYVTNQYPFKTYKALLTQTPPLSGNDFSSATYVYSDYTCEIFENSSNNRRLSFYDGSDVLNIVNVNA